jgi:cytochrome P450
MPFSGQASSVVFSAAQMSVTGLQDDLLAPEVVANPYPCLAALRAADPVHWSETHRAWLVTSYDDNVAAFNDEHLSSNRVKPLLAAMDPERRARVGRVLEIIADWMVVSDPPEHTRLRRLAQRAFLTEKIAALEGRVEAEVADLLDSFLAHERHELILHFAYPLPAVIIADLIGAPREDSDRFRGWSDELALVAFGAGGEARVERHERALRGLEEMLAYFGDLIEEARKQPRDDMIGRLVEPDPATGEQLSDDELKGMCALMLFAGHETTTNSIANGVLALLRNPDQLERLRADPKLAQRAGEEVLRYDGPIKVLHRWVVGDFELRGKKIEEGQRVFLLPAAANRDPARFESPDAFDVGRNPNPHVAFGRGIHTCIGAQLARLETRIALARILERLPNLRLADEEIHHHDILAARALHELRVDYDV